MSEEEDMYLTPLKRTRSQIPRMKKIRTPVCRSQASLQRETKKGKNKPIFSPSEFSCSPSKKEKEKTAETIVIEESINILDKKLYFEVCSLCMMPWIPYECNGRSREFHTDKCLDVDFSVKPECELGLECNEELENHFWKFSHKVLAEIRADHECALSQSLLQIKDQEDKIDIIELENTQFPSNEDFTVAGPSGIKRASASKRGGRSSRPSKSQISSVESHVSSEANKSMELLNYDDEEDEVLFENKRPLLGKLNPVMKRHKNLRNEHYRRKVISDNYENIEIPDLDITSLSTVDDERLEGDGAAIEFIEQKDQNGTVGFSDTKSNACDLSECDEKSSTYCDFNEISLDSSLVAWPHIVTENTVDGGTPNEQLNKSQSKGDHVRGTKTKTIKNNNVDGNTDLDKPICSRLEYQENYGVTDKENVQRNDINKSAVSTSEKDQGTKTHETLCERGPSCKPCIHLHIHLENTPGTSKSSGQTNILDFFQPLKADNILDSTATNKSAACCACGEGAGEIKLKCEKSQAESWKEFMSLMQKKKTNPPNIMKNSISLRGNKDQQQNQDKNKKWQQRRCPFYKYIPDTDIVVDAFCYGYLEGVRAYFLTHFHYDHYRGLKKSFNHPIYCSEITAKLVNLRIGVPNQYLHPLPLEESRVVCGVEVTLLDANHCPGSVMFLFKLRTGSTILHVGDFRAHPKMESYPALLNASVDVLYLDTTYCNPLYNFPSQEAILRNCVSVATHHVHNNSKTLIVVGSYSIGKERVFKAIASSLNCLLWASTDKRKILQCIQDEEIQGRLTSDKYSARVHILPMMDLKPRTLMKYIETLKPHYTMVVAIRPTGWEHSGDDGVLYEPKQYGNIYIYGIPYSEHSSYLELKHFVQFINPKKVIPTVNVGNPNTRKRMEQDIEEWLKNSSGSSVTKL